jgi:hypothetical protein
VRMLKLFFILISMSQPVSALKKQGFNVQLKPAWQIVMDEKEITTFINIQPSDTQYISVHSFEVSSEELKFYKNLRSYQMEIQRDRAAYMRLAFFENFQIDKILKAPQTASSFTSVYSRFHVNPDSVMQNMERVFLKDQRVFVITYSVVSKKQVDWQNVEALLKDVAPLFEVSKMRTAFGVQWAVLSTLIPKANASGDLAPTEVSAPPVAPSKGTIVFSQALADNSRWKGQERRSCEDQQKTQKITSVDFYKKVFDSINESKCALYHTSYLLDFYSIWSAGGRKATGDLQKKMNELIKSNPAFKDYWNSNRVDSRNKNYSMAVATQAHAMIEVFRRVDKDKLLIQAEGIDNLFTPFSNLNFSAGLGGVKNASTAQPSEAKKSDALEQSEQSSTPAQALAQAQAKAQEETKRYRDFANNVSAAQVYSERLIAFAVAKYESNDRESLNHCPAELVEKVCAFFQKSDLEMNLKLLVGMQLDERDKMRYRNTVGVVHSNYRKVDFTGVPLLSSAASSVAASASAANTCGSVPGGPGGAAKTAPIVPSFSSNSSLNPSTLGASVGTSPTTSSKQSGSTPDRPPGPPPGSTTSVNATAANTVAARSVASSTSGSNAMARNSGFQISTVAPSSGGSGSGSGTPVVTSDPNPSRGPANYGGFLSPPNESLDSDSQDLINLLIKIESRGLTEKSEFAEYKKLIESVGQLQGSQPEIIDTLVRKCNKVSTGINPYRGDFIPQPTLICLQNEADAQLKNLKPK